MVLKKSPFIDEMLVVALLRQKEVRTEGEQVRGKGEDGEKLRVQEEKRKLNQGNRKGEKRKGLKDGDK